MTYKLPLFPLNTVLFPGATLPLHIFEERYRLMIGRCIEQHEPFGVVLIREANRLDTDAQVSFHMVGTTAQINEGAKLEDNRYIISTLGQRRFQIQYVAQRAPYFVGAVTFLAEESGAPVLELASDLRGLYSHYWQALSNATGYQYDSETPPDDIIEMTYWMAHRLQVDNTQKQRWLEADVSTRIREIGAALRAEIGLLPSGGPPPNRIFNAGDRQWVGPGSWN